ncbi:MAG: hypothetical protein LBD58_10325 [Treponema sp.]|jgi:hypothetical protein|nr:hypothetical protein [Treponema sp.]
MTQDWLSEPQTKSAARDLRADRAKTISARRKEAFDVSSAFMLDFKRRYFFAPPLTCPDTISLNMKTSRLRIRLRGFSCPQPDFI